MEMVTIETRDNVPSGFMPIGKVGTVAATPSTIAFENIKTNLKGNYIRFHNIPEFKKIKGNLPIALVGGGPSLKKTTKELREYRTIFACGSVHDYLIENDIVPTYQGICDPDPVSINYLQKLHPEVKYMVASGCDPEIFKHLKDNQIVLWHCHSDDYNDKIAEIDKNYEAIGGGCTIGLRAISMAIMMGYNNIHFFGFDSCLSDEESYAYKISTQKEKDDQGDIYQLKIGMYWDKNPQEKVYNCLGYHLAQAEHFKNFLGTYPTLFKPTFHGDGLLPDLVAMLNEETKKMELNDALKNRALECLQ